MHRARGWELAAGQNNVQQLNPLGVRAGTYFKTVTVGEPVGMLFVLIGS